MGVGQGLHQRATDIGPRHVRPECHASLPTMRPTSELNELFGFRVDVISDGALTSKARRLTLTAMATDSMRSVR